MTRQQPGHGKPTTPRTSSRSPGTGLRAAGSMVALAAATAGATGGLWWLTSGLLDARQQGGTTFDEAVGLAAALGCWVCVSWFVLALSVTAASAIPGAVGRSCAVAAEVLAPWTLRKVVVAGLGLSVVTGPAAAAVTAPPAQQGAAPAVAAVVLVEPHARAGLTQSAGLPGQVHQGAAPTRLDADLPPLDRPADDAYAVTVRPGDCLWSIAGRHLGPRATDADIAGSWPRWYAANRDVIGSDPNLLQPGQHLTAPR